MPEPTPEPIDELKQLQQELHQSHGTPPSHIEMPAIVADEVARLDAHPIMRLPELQITSPEEYVAEMQSGPKPEPESDFEAPLQSVDLLRAGGVVLSDVQPLGELELMRPNRQPERVAVIGAVTFVATSEYYQILETENGGVGVVRIDAAGRTVRPEIADQLRYVSYATLRGSISVSKSGGERPELSIRYSHSTTKDRAEPTLIVNQATDVQEVAKLQAERVRKDVERKFRTRKGFLQSALAGVALWTVVTPGGLLDWSMDPFSDSRPTVARAMELVAEQNNTQGHLSEADIQQAEARLSQTMNDLDEHNYDAILERAETYYEAHQSEFMTKQDREKLFEDLTQAQTREDLLAALEKLGDFYGYDFEISEALPFDAAKYTAQETAAALTLLPLGLTEEAAIDTFYLGVDNPNDDRSASYSATSRTVTVGSITEAEESARIAAARLWSGASSAKTIQEIVIHEFGHGLANGNSQLAVIDYDQLGPSGESAEFHDSWINMLTNSPEAITTYARSEYKENQAENLSGALSNRTDGLIHPDETRRFQSGANRAVLAALGNIDAYYPGFADFRIATNPGLMNGQTLEHWLEQR